MSNNDLCESIVNHANRIYQSLANMNSQQNENGSITNPQITSQMTSIQGFTSIILLLFIAYAILSFISPRKQILSQKEQFNGQQYNKDEDD
ncbi:unnamed protein product [Paramecium primaurelia]|uniref:Uncharacterized protein n=1 Tax=Paramecium primaurelia TaxID=5886 RepID=A0A8S1N3P6_PARPR|nr:unnamed protein product [Paramecium primaurelia]